MKPSQLATFLVAAIAARLPVLVKSSPGEGKSDIIAQSAARAGADLIISHPAVADPTDAKGLPWASPDGESATFLPFGELARALRATSPTVWFLDDLGQAPPSVQASYMQLLLARRVNGHVLPDVVTFVAATNRRTDRAGVSGILEPVKSRFGAIVELTADLDEWCAWALAHGVPPVLVAFLRFRPELLSDFQPTADLTNSPSPRTWANVGRLVGLDLPPAIFSEAARGAVGEGPAVEFDAFRRLWAELPSVDGILVDPDASDLPTKPATLYAVVTALGTRVNVSTFPRIARYAERLTEGGHGEFAALLLRDAVRQDAAVQSTPAFVQLATGPLGDIIGGTHNV